MQLKTLILAGLSAITLTTTPTLWAGDVSWSITIGGGGNHYQRPYYRPHHNYVHPRPVYVQPRPVVVVHRPRPVYVQPRPVVVVHRPRPVVVHRPRPVVINTGYYRPHYQRPNHRPYYANQHLY